MEHPGIVLPRDTILNAVWEYDYAGDVRTIDTLVKQLRKKLGEGCYYIRTVYGVGYIFGEDIHENLKRFLEKWESTVDSDYCFCTGSHSV